MELRPADPSAAPEMPLKPQPEKPEGAESTEYRTGLAQADWSSLAQIAQERSVTPAAVVLTAAADVLRLWSRRPDFALDLLPQDGGPARALTFDVAGADSFTARAERVQRQLDADNAPGATTAPTAPADPPYSYRAAERDGGLSVTWRLRDELFPAGLADDVVAVCTELLHRLARDPDAWDAPGRLTALPAWQAAERADANSTAADLPAATLCGLVEARAAETPDAVAVIAEDGRLTYDEVVTAARRLARRLTGLGATPGELVGVVVDKGAAQVPAVLGVTLSRAAYLPIDPQWPAARRAQLIEQGGVRTVVTTAALRDRLEWPAGIRLVTPDDPEVRQADAGPLPAAPTPDDLAYVIFTSGSTGQPKGVVIDHRGAANTVQDINSRFGVGPADRVLALSSLSFDLSVYDVFGALAAGAAVVLPAPGRAHDPEHWSDLVARHGVTVWNSVPALMRVWLESPAPVPAGAPLRLVLLSGDWIPVSLPDAIRAPYPEARVISLGGATEASIWSVHYPIGDVPADWKRIPYGKPLANQTLHVLDAALDPCPVWSTGEIHIGGTGVAKGYWADPVRTAERFLVHPVTGETLYRTGDLGRYLPGGDIEFLGREDTQVKVNGYRIELDEIAAAVRRQPGVREGIVTVDTNPATGRGQLVAYVVPEDTATPSEDAPDTAALWPAVLEAAQGELTAAVAELAPRTETFRALWHRLEALAPTVMARNLARLGVFTTPGDTATADDIVERTGIRPLYRGLVAQWLTVLAARGVLRPVADRPAAHRAERPLDADRLDAEIAAALDGITAAGPDEVLLEYFTSCIDRQIPLLQGTVRPLQLLLPDGDWRVTRALYATNPAAVLQNRIAARAVARYAERFPADRKVRVLEIGAGTGATADRVLPALPADRVTYHFTDLSTAFTEPARKRYDDVHPFVTYGLFDIDEDPAGQGLAPGSVDVVVAANVLHDAKNLTKTLAAVRRLLAPGGIAVLIEGTVNSPLNMISFAFLEGFGNYQDQREATLLSVPEWREQLTTAGFTRFASVPDGAAAVDALVQHVLIAGAPSGATGGDGPLDLAGLGGRLGELLPDYMVPNHFLVIDALPLSANGKVDRSALPSPWRESAPEERTVPRSELEQRLFAIWSEALGRDDFGTGDNFFDLGGDSLHAVRMAGRFRSDLGVDRSGDELIDLLFEAPTIEELAAVLAPDVKPAAPEARA